LEGFFIWRLSNLDASINLNIYQYRDNFSKLKDVNCVLLSGDTGKIPEPLLSIIITLYKRKKYVLDAIYSAIRQESILVDYEIIIISDDPDDTLSELNDFVGIKNVYLYRNSQNIGLYNNCNMGAKIARGKYISFLHDDDILYPNYLLEVCNFLRFIKPDAECILINRDIQKSNIKINILKETISKSLKILFFLFYLIRFFLRKPYKSITLREGLTYQLSNVYKAPSCGTLFKKSAFIDSGGFNQDFWPVTDYFFFIFFNKFHNVYMLRKKLACYRWLDNLSQNKNIQFLSMKFLYNFFQSEQPFESVNNYFKLFTNELIYTKYLMVNEAFRDEIKFQYPEVMTINKIRWCIYKLYNLAFRFFHDIV
jgi:glycosyltransferase involved in cell wall biosynthesis